MTCYGIIKHPLFEATSLSVIMINSVTLALDQGDDEETTPGQAKSGLAVFLEFMDGMFLNIYTVEMILKILALGFIFNKGSYLRNSWNILDFVIVISAWLTYIENLAAAGAEDTTA